MGAGLGWAGLASSPTDGCVGIYGDAFRQLRLARGSAGGYRVEFMSHNADEAAMVRPGEVRPGPGGELCFSVREVQPDGSLVLSEWRLVPDLVQLPARGDPYAEQRDGADQHQLLPVLRGTVSWPRDRGTGDELLFQAPPGAGDSLFGSRRRLARPRFDLPMALMLLASSGRHNFCSLDMPVEAKHVQTQAPMPADLRLINRWRAGEGGGVEDGRHVVKSKAERKSTFLGGKGGRRAKVTLLPRPPTPALPFLPAWPPFPLG